MQLAGWFPFLLRNVRRKDEFMSRHWELAAYEQRTGMLLSAFGPGVSQAAMALVSVLAAFLFCGVRTDSAIPNRGWFGSQCNQRSPLIAAGAEWRWDLGIAKDLRIGRVLTR